MSQPAKKDGFWNKVAVGVAVALAVAAVLGAVRYLAPEAWGAAGRFASHLGEPVEVARWWHWLLVAYFTGTLMAVAGVVGRAYLADDGEEHHAYTQDRIMGANWQWRWVGGRVKELWCRCDCGRSMTYSSGRNHFGDVETHIGCEACHVPAIRRPGYLRHALGEVEREIDLKVHNGSWKRTVDAQGR